VFKGGTSLSKVFGVIERFSEDIDLSLSPHCRETATEAPRLAALSHRCPDGPPCWRSRPTVL
jgi:hypothetical protein